MRDLFRFPFARQRETRVLTPVDVVLGHARRAPAGNRGYGSYGASNDEPALFGVSIDP